MALQAADVGGRYRQRHIDQASIINDVHVDWDHRHHCYSIDTYTRRYSAAFYCETSDVLNTGWSEFII